MWSKNFHNANIYNIMIIYLTIGIRNGKINIWVIHSYTFLEAYTW